MDEATREQWVSQQVSLATSLKHEQQQQQLMQDLRDLTPPSCRPVRRERRPLPRRGGPRCAAPEREEFARAEQAQVARADHNELARLTLEQQQEKALAELGPELGKLEEQTQQSALTEQQLLAEKIAAEREWGPCNPNSNGRRNSTPAFGKSSSNCRRSSRRGCRSGRCSSPWSRAGASSASRWTSSRSSTSSGGLA